MQWSKWARPAPHTAPVHAKAAGLYMICTMSKHDAEAAGFDDALMLDWRGQLAEGTGANIFLVINGELHTPTPDCFLNGITRQTVIGLAKSRGIKVVERAIMPQELAKADEVFLTGSAAEVTPVGEVSGHAGNFRFTPGAICRLMWEDFDRTVGKKVAGRGCSCSRVAGCVGFCAIANCPKVLSSPVFSRLTRCARIRM
jgi:branched-chain amino acid aminotransferase